jgi:Autographiviridae endonuclease VII
MPKSVPTHCKKCNVELTILNSVRKYYTIRNLCVTCYNEHQREWKNNNPDSRKRSVRKNVIKNSYGLSEFEYHKLIELHQNACTICRKPEIIVGKSLAVDHNHETGEVRGLLCHKCNVALGMLNENEDLIWNMMEYLKHTTWNKKDVA